MTYVIKKMEFDVTRAGEVKSARDWARNHRMTDFSKDDEYIETLINDNVKINGNNCEFTQILKIVKQPPAGDKFVIDNAIEIMKHYHGWDDPYSDNPLIDNWAFFTTESLDNARSATIKTMEDMKKEKNNYKYEDGTLK
ncbi:MAG: hypothetical protein ACFFD7_11625 [Candidatus Thorarchaeota archaeon]